MKTKFSIIQFYDPYGDMKSERREASRENYESDKPISEVQDIIEKYNDGKYYHAVTVTDFQHNKKKIKNFDTSHFLTSKAPAARYEHIPGY